MNIEISLFDKVCHSPADQILTMALLEMQQNSSLVHGPTRNESVLVARVEKNLAGFLVYHLDEKSSAIKISMAYTIPSYRRKGVYNTLFQTLVMKAKTEGDIMAIDSDVAPTDTVIQHIFEKQKRMISKVSYTYRIRDYAVAKVPFDIKGVKDGTK